MVEYAQSVNVEAARERATNALNQACESGATLPVRGLCRIILVRIIFDALIVSYHSAKQADANRRSNRADEVCDVTVLNVQRRLVDVPGSRSTVYMTSLVTRQLLYCIIVFIY